MTKAGQNQRYEKDYFTTGLTEKSRRNTRDILLDFLGNQTVNKKAKNISRKAKTKKRK